MTSSANVILHRADVCVIGGGMAGLIAAVSAARHGARVLLMQDRPVLGGNASSEIRMWIRGAAGKENRETGLLQEIELENIYRNPTMNYSVWDSVLLQTALGQKGLTLLLNCTCLEAETEGARIARVRGWQLNTYTFHEVEAALFLDCSGDSILASLTGAAFRAGREGRQELGESGAPPQRDRKTMGTSCLLQARQTDHPCPFTPPEWAYVYPDDESLYGKNHDFIHTDVNFWWIELGGEGDTLLDTQATGEELLKVAFGVWDHIKNRGDHGAENWELEWIGFLPGKRESRRYEGDYLLTQRDLENDTVFPDTVAYGGWTMDNHAPEGLRYPGYSSHHYPVHVPYPIPYRCLYSRNIDNLLFAGRNISVSHMALSSTRVMATCSLLGQAAGTAAALCVQKRCLPRALGREHIALLQQTLEDDGCYLPGRTRPPRGAFALSLPEADAALLRNGWERPHAGNENRLLLPENGAFTLSLPASAHALRLRLALDADFSRESISPSPKSQTFALRAHIFRDEPPLRMPAPLLKSARIQCALSDGSERTLSVADNRRALLFIPLPENTLRVAVSDLASWGGAGVGLFSVDVLPQP